MVIIIYYHHYTANVMLTVAFCIAVKQCFAFSLSAAGSAGLSAVQEVKEAAR